jgi:hypothetical protein
MILADISVNQQLFFYHKTYLIRLIIDIMSNESKDEVLDVYVFKSDGLPIVAGCTGTEYCQSHASNHELHTAFMAALQSFSKETFSENSVKTVAMDDFQLNMQPFLDNRYIFATVHTSGSNTDSIRKKVEKGIEVFVAKYGDVLQEKMLDQNKFNDFIYDLDNIGLVPDDMFHDKTESFHKEKPKKVVIQKDEGFFSRLKGVFDRS